MDLYRLTIQDSQDSMQFDLLDAPIKIEDVEGAVDNTVLTGDIFTDYLFLKKRWEQKWAIMCKDEYERLRGFYTRQWSLATVPSVKVTQGYLENASWEGQIFYINAPYGGEVSSLTKMTGDTYQETLSGKNLAKSLNGNYSYASADQAWTLIDGEITTSRSGINHQGGSLDITTGNVGQYATATSGDSHLTGDGGTYVFSLSRNGEINKATGQTARVGCYIYKVNSSNTKTNLGIVDLSEAESGSLLINLASNEHVAAIVFYTQFCSYTDVTFKAQLEAGSTATPFEPYCGGMPSPNPVYPQDVQTVTGTQTITINGQAFPIDLGAIELCKLGDAQDSIYYDGSDWILRKENAKHYFTTASGTGSTWEGARHRMYFTNTWQTANGINFATHTDTLTPAQILADKFVSLSFDDLYNNGKDGIALSATTTLSIRNNNWNDATTARSEIEGTTMYYALATPTETTITDATLISQLNAIQAALQEGQNTVAVTANGSNLPAKTITLNGIAGREKPVLAQTNVRIGLSDGGVLNACECRQNVTLSMRETA